MKKLFVLLLCAASLYFIAAGDHASAGETAVMVKLKNMHERELPDMKQVVAGMREGVLSVFALGDNDSVYHKYAYDKNKWNDWWAMPFRPAWGDVYYTDVTDIDQIALAQYEYECQVFMICNGGIIRPLNLVGQQQQGPWYRRIDHDIDQLCFTVNGINPRKAFFLSDGSLYAGNLSSYSIAGYDDLYPLGGHDLQQICAAENEDGRLEVFALGDNGAIYHIWQTDDRGTWGTWATLQGTDIQAITVDANENGRIELFALGGDGAIYHISQVIPNGNWGKWTSLAGHDIKQVVVEPGKDKRLQLFALGDDGAVYYKQQVTVNGDFGAWSSLQGHDIENISAALDGDGVMQLFAIGGDGKVYHRSQYLQDGVWTPWMLL